jgi:hypothetical protein
VGTSEDRDGGTVAQLMGAGKVAAGAAGEVAGDRLRVEVDARSSRAAVELKTLAVAARASSESLRAQGHEGQAELVDELASRADRLAVRLATSDTDELLDDARRLARQAAAFARREPLLVIAGAFTLGLLVPKVLEAIADDEGAEEPNEARASKPEGGAHET